MPFTEHCKSYIAYNEQFVIVESNDFKWSVLIQRETSCQLGLLKWMQDW